MAENKLLHFLRLMSPTQLEGFRKFVSSPYFNEKKHYSQLLHVMCERLLENGAELSDVEVDHLVFGEAEFRKYRFKKLKAGLLQLFMEYLTMEQFRNRKGLHKKFLLESLNDLAEEKYFLRYYSESLAQLQNSPLPQEDLMQERMYLEEEYNRFVRRQPDRIAPFHWQEVMENMGTSFLLRMLKYIIISLNWQKITGKSLELLWLEPVLELLRETEARQTPTIRMFYGLYHILSHPEDTEGYFNLRALIKAYGDLLSQSEMYNLYISLVNYASRRVNMEDREFLAEVLSLYEEAMEREVLGLDPNGFPFHYKNMVSAACQSGQFEKAAWMIDAYEKLVPKAVRETAVNHNRAVLLFGQKRYREAARHLHKVLEDYEDVFYGLDARALLLRIYYESGEFALLESLLESFRLFLYRNATLSQSIKNSYGEYIRFFRRLINVPPRNKERLDKLKADILESGGKGGGKVWLLEKIGSLLEEID